MSRNRDIANVLSKSTPIALDSEVGLVPITPSSIAVTGGSGSISLNTVSFTSASAVSLNGVFSADYDNYFIIGNVNTNANNAILQHRYRVNGTDNLTTNSYDRRRLAVDGTILTGVQSFADSALTTFIDDDFVNSFKGYFFMPFLTSRTNFLSEGVDSFGPIRFQQTRHNQVASYDGFSIFPNSGNVSGTISIYGYRK